MPLSTKLSNKIEYLARRLNTTPDNFIEELLAFVSKKPHTPSQKIRAIEQEALSKKWTNEQLWKKPEYPRYDQMGLICFVDKNHEIGEVTEQSIEIKNACNGNSTRIYNKNVEQPFIKKVGNK